ncbi:M48 family metallopeptidase [Filimonas effusa]|uniref:M48 family metallopeptidase n=1 Tax=Filimonas effusa TaxID=2508721 RepID=A0A4Q1D674_9BACT|nr:M48 family metallopeptidase [Filimonas effusa]RXK83918.1 M48 family metallopeptidase [Filimonas effusa]
MLHNNTPGLWFQGQYAQPKAVKLLLFNDKVNLYASETEEFLAAFAIKDCRIATEGVPVAGGSAFWLPDQSLDGERRAIWHKIYVSADASGYLLLNEANAITGFLLTAIQNKNQPILGRLRRSGPLLLLTGIFAAVVIFCYFLFTALIPAMGLRLISVQQETALGHTLFKSTVNANIIDTQASRIAQDFAGQLPLSKQYAIRVYVVEDKTVNAFALPGGIIVIHSGIIHSMGSYEELAALLGHEVTHINDRHSLRSMLQSFSFSALLSVITGDASGLTGVLASNAAQLESLSYSRKLETDADEKSMELLQASGINPEGMIRLMKRLQAEEHGGAIAFLSSHPLTSARIEHAAAFIKKHAGESYPVNTSLQQCWRQLKSGGTSF